MTVTLRPRRHRLATLLLAAVVFASGIVVGAGGATVAIARRAREAIQHPEQMPDRLVDRLRRRLDLRADQIARIRAIFVERQRALAGIRARVRPQVVGELAGVREDVGGVLDATQRRRWDAIYDDLVAKWLPADATKPAATPRDAS